MKWLLKLRIYFNSCLPCVYKEHTWVTHILSGIHHFLCIYNIICNGLVLFLFHKTVPLCITYTSMLISRCTVLILPLTLCVCWVHVGLGFSEPRSKTIRNNRHIILYCKRLWYICICILKLSLSLHYEFLQHYNNITMYFVWNNREGSLNDELKKKSQLFLVYSTLHWVPFPFAYHAGE